MSATGPNTPAEAGGYRVLIVEDNPHIIEMYNYVFKNLAGRNLEIHFRQDGHHALMQLRESRFHLVITELYLPVMDGFALVERIREEEGLRDILILAVSGGGQMDQERAMELGVNLYLRKPVSFIKVLEAVKQLLHIQ